MGKVTPDSLAQPIRERIEQLNQEKGEILSRAHGGNAAGGAASTDPYVKSLIDIFTKSQSSNPQGKFWGSTDAGSLPPMESAASQAYPEGSEGKRLLEKGYTPEEVQEILARAKNKNETNQNNFLVPH